MDSNSQRLTLHPSIVKRENRNKLLNQKNCIIWLTGLSGSGKSTLGRALEKQLITKGNICYVLDGDDIRHNLNTDLGFSREDRKENIRRIGEVAVLFADAGLITIIAVISPYKADRMKARQAAVGMNFIEVFLDVPIEVCEERDPKKLYNRAKAGEIPEFTGINAPYEAPEKPEIILKTAEKDIAECVNEIEKYLITSGIIERKVNE